MRSFLLCLSLVFLCTAYAQIPNPDFEQWKYYSGRPEPDGWTTYNQFSGSNYHVIPELPGFQSDTAINCRAIYNGFSNFPGYAEVTFPQTQRPVGLAWYSKHVRMAGDTVRIRCTLDPSSPVGTVKWDPANDVDTVNFVFHYEPINYLNANFPTTAKISLEGGSTGIPVLGTYLMVDQIHFCDSPPPSGSLTVAGDSTVSPGDTLVLTASGATGATVYSWSVPAGAVIISGNGTDQVTIVWGSSAGTVTVVASNDCGPGPSATVTVDVLSGTTGPVNVKLPVAPNPAVDVIYLSDIPRDGLLTITDMTGTAIMATWIHGSEASLRVSHLDSGTYLVRMGNLNTLMIIRR